MGGILGWCEGRWLVAPGLALLAAMAAVFLPVQPTVVSRAGPGPLHTTELEVTNHSLLQTEGAWIGLAAGLPAIVAFLPLAFAAGRHARRAAILSAALFGGFMVVAGFSIGLFYLPAALAAVLAARRPPVQITTSPAPPGTERPGCWFDRDLHSLGSGSLQ